METGKPGCAPVQISSVAAQTEKRMDIQAPLTAVYFHTVPALAAQPYQQPPAAAQEPATLHLAMPPLYSKETLPFLTLHIAGGMHSPPGLSLTAAAPTARPKSAGKHVCPHCGRDCMKPSVLEKHLRCHTGERPYPCTTCGVSFKTQSNLYKHKRTQAHARISSESEQSSVGSLDSMSSSRETHSSSLSLDEQSEDTGRAETDAAEVTGLATTTNVCSVQTQGSVCEQNEMTPAGRNRDPSESAKVRKVDEKTRVENEQPPLTAGRHLPLQRQKATLFSKQWESSVSRGQSQQSHESTDSGFSECSDHHLSPVSVLPDHGMDSLTESNKEHLEETTNTQAPSEAVKDAQEPKGAAREQEQRSLEERISKLISENTAVVEDKQLENVRPRKTVLSKQGSIDLPMPYTYKDSFHFDMRISKTQNVASQRNRKPGLYSSVPTQHSTTMEHAPLIRSNSLPFSVTLLQPERSSPASSCQSDYVTLVRRGSSGQINPVGFKPVSQQSATHRPLVRQTAVDCNHATDGPFMNSSVEEASSSSLSCDGEAADTCGEPSNRKFRRKKAQKFAYNKWYMYGGGTFKKLYSAEQGVDNSVIKGRKCVNPVHEGPQKRLSAVHKETNITCSGATVCHPGCPPPMSCMVSAVDSTVRTSQIYSLCSSLNSPIQRNLSLSIPQLPSAASPLSKTPDGKSSADAGTLVGDEKHAASTSLLCGAHVPSDRKKQRTDDKMISPNALTHHPPSGTGSAPQQDATFSFIDFQKHPKQTALTGALFSPCLISARVSSRPATSNAPTAKTSFLPKYQLKLPNAAETESKTSHQPVVDTGRETCGCTFTSPLSSSRPEQTSTVVTAPEKTSSGAFTSSMMQTGDLNKTNAFNSTQAQLLSPCTATTFYPAETSRFSEHVTSSLTAVHQQFAAATITTTCRQDYQAGTCSTLIQPSKCAPVQLHTPAAPVVTTLPASIMTANSETSAAVPQCQPNSNSNPPLSHAQVVTTTVPLNPANKTNNSKVPCHVVPFDQVQPAAQNVFHVHTADLQICLQIISDEQLALIEPQIERQVDSSLSHRHDMEALTPERVEDKALKENSATKESGNEGRKQPGQRKEVDQSKSLPTVHMETMTPPTVCPLPNIHMPELTKSSQATASADPKPREAQGLISHPHKCSHVNTVRETLSSAIELMSNAASLEGARTGRGLVSEAERPLPLDQCAEEQLVLHRGGRSGGPVIQSLPDQHKLSMTCRTGSQLPGKETEPKRDQGASSNDSIMGNKDETFAHNGSMLTSVETFPSTHSNFRKGSGGASEPSGSDSFLSVSKCKSPRHMSPQASGYSNPPEPTLSDTAKPLNDENWVCDRMGTLDNSAPLLETDRSSSAQKQVDQFTSVSSTVQVERSKDILAAPISVQTPPAGHLEGDCQAGYGPQQQAHSWGHEVSPGQKDHTAWRPKLSHEAGEANLQRADGQRGGAAMRDDKNGGMIREKVPGQQDDTTSNCTHTVVPDTLKPQGEDTDFKVDSAKNSWRFQQHLQPRSQAQSGMSASYPPPSPQETPSTSNNLHLPASARQTSLFNSPQAPLETHNSYFSQQLWESSIIQSQQTQISCESNSGQLKQPQAPLNKEAHSACSQVVHSPLQTTLSHQPQKQQGHTAGNNNMTGTMITLASGKGPGLSSDVKTPSPAHQWQVPDPNLLGSRSSAGLMGNSQASNIYMQDNKDQAAGDDTTHSSNSERNDITSKYQSFFLTGIPAESLSSGVRPVPSCQDYMEDSSSSDDEGKLIIEL